jgi:hypothetical protein
VLDFWPGPDHCLSQNHYRLWEIGVTFMKLVNTLALDAEAIADFGCSHQGGWVH